MHVGRTTGSASPLLALCTGRQDGAISADGRVAGCYVHGMFGDDRQRRHWLTRIGAESSMLDYEAEIDATLDLLADHIEKHVNCRLLLELARSPELTSRGQGR
jgi:adenosylcobyric acid synthase